MTASKCTAPDTIGSQVEGILCTHPPARYYPYDAAMFLHLDGGRLLQVGTATCQIRAMSDAQREALYRAAGYNHKRYLEPDTLANLVVGCRIRRLIRTETVGYDHTMVVFSNDLVIGNCDMNDCRVLFVRSEFDEKRESETPYWDYFSDQPVNHLGVDCIGERRDPFRVAWV